MLGFLTRRRPVPSPSPGAEVAPPAEAYHLRKVLTDEFLSGSGLEIGALQQQPNIGPDQIALAGIRVDLCSGTRRHFGE